MGEFTDEEVLRQLRQGPGPPASFGEAHAARHFQEQAFDQWFVIVVPIELKRAALPFDDPVTSRQLVRQGTADRPESIASPKHEPVLRSHHPDLLRSTVDG
jgi:hypothetical protein